MRGPHCYVHARSFNDRCGINARQPWRAERNAAACCSGDGKLLLVAAAEPDYAVLLWRWHASKVGASSSPAEQQQQQL